MQMAADHLHLRLSRIYWYGCHERYNWINIRCELPQRPPALFDEVKTCITVRSAFLQLFSYTTSVENSTNYPIKTVIIDGYLLLTLIWLHSATYGQIADVYLDFVQNHVY
ncbi:hypothetical protein PR048_008963 [Dryococelus australis]|uniref:Uncharacterized protein n=1 Tax=Dryococelus australis TaxID=614101 RepID=A0ABQ9HZG7_9NEOP|nr:hypothetical protein PR048_008963 [Dryococelus australis]